MKKLLLTLGALASVAAPVAAVVACGNNTDGNTGGTGTNPGDSSKWTNALDLSAAQIAAFNKEFDLGLTEGKYISSLKKDGSNITGGYDIKFTPKKDGFIGSIEAKTGTELVITLTWVTDGFQGDVNGDALSDKDAMALGESLNPALAAAGGVVKTDAQKLKEKKEGEINTLQKTHLYSDEFNAIWIAKINDAKSLDELNKVFQAEIFASSVDIAINNFKKLAVAKSIAQTEIDASVKIIQTEADRAIAANPDETFYYGSAVQTAVDAVVDQEKTKLGLNAQPVTHADVNISEADITSAIVLTGSNGFGEIDYKDIDGIDDIDFDKEDGLSNADKVTLTISYESYGKGPATIEYTVSGLKDPIKLVSTKTADELKAVGVATTDFALSPIKTLGLTLPTDIKDVNFGFSSFDKTTFTLVNDEGVAIIITPNA